MSDPREIPKPGSKEAVRRGCTCTPHKEGYELTVECPVHWKTALVWHIQNLSNYVTRRHARETNRLVLALAALCLFILALQGIEIIKDWYQ